MTGNYIVPGCVQPLAGEELISTKMAFSDLPIDVPLQQYPVPWEISRLAQTRHDEHLGGGDGETSYQPNKQEDMELHISKLQNEVIRTSEVGEGGDEGKEHSRKLINDERHLNQIQAEKLSKNDAPTWVSTALGKRHNQDIADTQNEHTSGETWCHLCSATSGSQACICSLPMQAGNTTRTSFQNQSSSYSHWLQGAMHPPQHQRQGLDVTNPDYVNVTHQSRMGTALNLSPGGQRKDSERPFVDTQHSVPGTNYGGEYARFVQQTEREDARRKLEWEDSRRKAMIVSHSLYPDLLMAHAACLRVGAPVDQLPHIEAQLLEAQNVSNKYSSQHLDRLEVTEEEKLELDGFMTKYIVLLSSFKEVLQEHVYNDVTEAMMSCWELEQALHTVTGNSPGGGTGATMSDDGEDSDSDYDFYDPSLLDLQDTGGIGPLAPTDSERSLMERVRQELKYELKQGYRARIEDVREEILRKRRAGKLPEGTTTVLKAWWEAHAKWPYPTEDEKERLIQETGLELKQVNNWFINQRKRNWHSNPLPASTDTKIKRQRLQYFYDMPLSVFVQKIVKRRICRLVKILQESGTLETRSKKDVPSIGDSKIQIQQSKFNDTEWMQSTTSPDSFLQTE